MNTGDTAGPAPAGPQIADEEGAVIGLTDAAASEIKRLIKGVTVIVDLRSAFCLKGTTLDYVQSLTGGGFKFANPNATRSCGCGTSFSA